MAPSGKRLRLAASLSDFSRRQGSLIKRENFADFPALVRTAHTAERGLLDCVIFNGHLPEPTLLPPYSGSGASGFDAVQVLTAVAMLTSNIGLVAATDIMTVHPFNVARRIATLDHISRGRAGLAAVAEYACEGEEHRDPPGVLARAAEALHVVEGLWKSWDGDAVLRDKSAGKYYEPSKVHLLNHVGRFYQVRGPLNIERCPQGKPIIALVASEREVELAAASADLVVVAHGSFEAAQRFYAVLKDRALAIGRDPSTIIVLQAIALALHTSTVGRRRRGRASGASVLCANSPLGIEGASQEVADIMEQWVYQGAADGFYLCAPPGAASLDHLVETLVPELQQRGVFRTQYEESSLRELLGAGSQLSSGACFDTAVIRD